MPQGLKEGAEIEQLMHTNLFVLCLKVPKYFVFFPFLWAWIYKSKYVSILKLTWGYIAQWVLENFASYVQGHRFIYTTIYKKTYLQA